jgi:lactoylglutathione lyase
MLKKIDCVMIHVADLEAATSYYSEVFGLRPLWRDELSVGLGFPETDAEIVLHCNPDLPNPVDVHYLVDNVGEAIRLFREKGCQVLVEPFDIPIGQCAVIQDPFGTVLSILDITKGPRPLLATS